MKPIVLLVLALSISGGAALAPPALSATWLESYADADKAISSADWSSAVRHLNAALAERPSSGANVPTYGMRFIDYFPYLKLGIAYVELGQEEAALQAFETEQRQGAIGKSADAQSLLARYRERARANLEREDTQRAAERERRAPAVIGEGLATARQLEGQGRFEDALAALARTLAVAPDHAEAQLLRQRLLATIAREATRRSDEERSAHLIRQGKNELAAGSYRLAAASFSQAQEIAPSPELGALLEQAQAGLRAELGGRENADRALQLERRLRDEQAATDESKGRALTVAQLLAEAENQLVAGDNEAALRTAHRVLVLEPSNATALRQIAHAYGRLSDALLAPDLSPPSILFDDLAADPANLDGPDQTVVRNPQVTVTGTVYDRSPVEIRVLAGGAPVGETAVEGREFQGVWITSFRSRQHVPSGVTTLEVEAVDRAGNVARLTCRVVYDVPLVRSAWFAPTVALLIASAFAIWPIVRARRRRRKRQERFNPYIAGAPILERARFFGRQELLEYVLRRVPNNSVMLYGERRIGKTSFQHELKRSLTALDDPDHDYHPVFIDLQGTPQEKFFGTLAAEIFHELAPKLGGLQPSSPPGRDSYGYAELLRDLQVVLKELRGRTTKKVKLVLLIDEVDELNDYDPRVNQRLRSLFMRAFADNLVAVVSGVSIKKQWEREGSPWYNFFQEVEVKPLDPVAARSLIESPVRGVFGFEGTADEILRRTGAKPYLIQRLCSSLVDRLHQESRRTITRADVETACRVEGL